MVQGAIKGLGSFKSYNGITGSNRSLSTKFLRFSSFTKTRSSFWRFQFKTTLRKTCLPSLLDTIYFFTKQVPERKSSFKDGRAVRRSRSHFLTFFTTHCTWKIMVVWHTEIKRRVYLLGTQCLARRSRCCRQHLVTEIKISHVTYLSVTHLGIYTR